MIIEDACSCTKILCSEWLLEQDKRCRRHSFDIFGTVPCTMAATTTVLSDTVSAGGEGIESLRALRKVGAGLVSGDNIPLRAALDALPAAIYTTDAAGRITYYNAAAAALWGCCPELGTSAWCGSWKLYWPDGTRLPHDQCPMAMALRERRPIVGMEAVAERPDGSRVPFMPYPTPLYDELGQLIGAVNMLVDVSDRKLAGAYAQRLASIVESSDDAIVSTNLDSLITSWNTGAERLFGYTADDVVGRSILLLLPDDRKDEEAGILERIRRGERVDHYETVRRRKDGSRIDVSLTVSPLRDADGRIIGASKIARDITEGKRIQDQQALLVHESQHRLKNSLAIVQAIASQTLRSASAGDRAAFIGRLQSLAATQDLLTYDTWKRVPLREVLDRALAPFQELQRERIAHSGPEDVWLDAGKMSGLTMALHELATNAAKYGALSNRTGRVSITWDVRADMNPATLVLVWKESGGPPVEPPAERGFGSLLLDRAVDGDIGTARLTFKPEGVECVLELAL